MMAAAAEHCRHPHVVQKVEEQFVDHGKGYNLASTLPVLAADSGKAVRQLCAFRRL